MIDRILNRVIRCPIRRKTRTAPNPFPPLPDYPR